jgi:MFS family permease
MRLDQNRSSACQPAAQRPAFLAVFPSIVLPMFLAVVDQTIVATALPAIAAYTGNVERASWVVVSYLIASTIAAPIYGRLGDAFGRRRLMFVALSVFIGASLLCAASPTIELLALARVVQGLGGGGLMTLSQALIGEAIPPRERARYQGYLAAVAVCANTFGPVAGGFLTERFGWQSVFLINVPLGIIAVLLTGASE